MTLASSDNPDRAPNGDAIDNSASEVLRCRVAELDQILGQPLRVLDDGFIRLVDYMGSDASIVQAARVSYGVGTTKVQDDRGLVRYLMRHSHTTPFEMCEIKLHVRVPMDLWRQWIRHRTASVNEYSTRYSVAIDATQRTSPNAWRFQSSKNKQGSEGVLPYESGLQLSTEEEQFQQEARAIYEKRLAAGVAREQARKDLPLATYTEAYWKIDLHNLLHFLHLRMDPHAQLEIRTYAKMIGEEIVSKWVPNVWEAFRDYRLEAVRLSRIEAGVIGALIARAPQRAKAILEEASLLSKTAEGKLARSREREELEQKLQIFNLEIPWG